MQRLRQACLGSHPSNNCLICSMSAGTLDTSGGRSSGTLLNVSMERWMLDYNNTYASTRLKISPALTGYKTACLSGPHHTFCWSARNSFTSSSLFNESICVLVMVARYARSPVSAGFSSRPSTEVRTIECRPVGAVSLRCVE